MGGFKGSVTFFSHNFAHENFKKGFLTVDIVGALGAKPPQPAARETEAPKERTEDDGGKSRERFDEALDHAATAPAEKGDESRAPKTGTEGTTAKSAAEPRPDHAFDNGALTSVIAIEDLAKSPRDLDRPIAAPVLEVETDLPSPEAEADSQAKLAKAGAGPEIAASLTTALAPATEKEAQPATVQQATPEEAAPAATLAATGRDLKRANISPAEPAPIDPAERIRAATAKENKALHPTAENPRAVETASPVIAKLAATETDKPAPSAIALAQSLESSLKDARAGERQFEAGLDSIPDLAGKLKLGASPSALQPAMEKLDLLVSTPQPTTSSEPIALLQDVSNQLHVNTGTKLEIHQHSPAATADAARQVIAAIRTGAGGDGIEVRLDPPDLGRVRIHFTVDRADSVTAVVTSDRSDTHDMMRRHSADLAKELARAGFANVQMEFKSGGGGGQQPDAALEPRGSGLNVEDDALEATHVVYARARFEGRLDRLV